MSETAIREAFRMQAQACADLDSPFMARLMTLAADRLKEGGRVSERLFDWPGDVTFRGESVPLRFAGALHALKLQEIALDAVYPPHDVSDDALWSAVEEALDTHAARILDWLDRAPQTNEVRRAAVILPVLAELTTRFGLPVHLMELGASGGLNLRMERFFVEAGETRLGDARSAVRLSPEWTGPSLSGDLPEVVSRSGVDLSPVDPATAEGRLRLLSYLWPDQPERIARTDAAIDVARETPAEVDRADAGAWLDAKLVNRPNGALTVIYHTVAWQYFPASTRARAKAAIDHASKNAASDAPLVRIGMEGDGGHGAAVHLYTMSNPDGYLIARADFHGRWIDWKGLPDAL